MSQKRTYHVFNNLTSIFNNSKLIYKSSCKKISKLMNTTELFEQKYYWSKTNFEYISASVSASIENRADLDLETG